MSTVKLTRNEAANRTF